VELSLRVRLSHRGLRNRLNRSTFGMTPKSRQCESLSDRLSVVDLDRLLPRTWHSSGGAVWVKRPHMGGNPLQEETALGKAKGQPLGNPLTPPHGRPSFGRIKKKPLAYSPPVRT